MTAASRLSAGCGRLGRLFSERLNDPAHRFHKALLDQIVNRDRRRLGDAILAGQAAYAETGAFPELLTIYHLLGDPALRLR